MPSFDRRKFMQLLGAASVAPFAPAMPVRAARASASLSKALWAGIYAKSGSAENFVHVARGMGLSNSAIQGVSARSVGARIAFGAATQSVPTVARNGATTVTSSRGAQRDPLASGRRWAQKLDELVTPEKDAIEPAARGETDDPNAV